MTILNDDQLFAAAPAIFADRSDPARTSDKYGFMSTVDALKELEQHGWLPTAASQDNPRLRDRRYVAHTVTLTHEDLMGQQEGAVPNIILFNSHNGRNKMKMLGGMYRFVCANGLIIGTEQAKAEFRHDRKSSDIIGEYTQKFANDFTDLQRTIDRWSNIELSGQKANDFAAQARELRFGESAGNYRVADLLEARRAEDDARDLWSVYNVVQENTVKGGIRGETANKRATRSRELNAIGPNLQFNDALWKLAQSIADAA